MSTLVLMSQLYTMQPRVIVGYCDTIEKSIQISTVTPLRRVFKYLSTDASFAIVCRYMLITPATI